MSNRLYLVPLPDSQTTTVDEGVSAQIQQSGLLQEGGVAVEKIASDNIDLEVSGQWRFGETFSKKLADELESLGESGYSGLPFFDPDAADSGRNKGYYEVESVDVNPSHPSDRDVFEYTVGLTFTGTRETHWRAVQTNVEDIQTGLATGSGGLIGIPATAGKVRWFDEATGTEAATADSTVSAEFGDVALFDPADATADDPTLIYEVPFVDESPVDVRVFDDLGKDKYYRSGGAERDYNTGDYGIGIYGGYDIIANQWVHAFHPAFEFDGDPVVENGLLRLRFDETAGELEAFTLSGGTGGSYNSVTLDQSNFNLIDADIERIGPSRVDVFAEFEETADGTLETAVLSIQRGLDSVVVRDPENNDIPTDLETMLDPIASDQTTDATPGQTLEPRNEVK